MEKLGHRRVSLKDLDALDNGSSEGLVEQVRQVTKNERDFYEVLTLVIVDGFIRRCKEDAAMKTEENNIKNKKSNRSENRKKPRKNSEVYIFAELGLETPPGMPIVLQNYMESVGGEDPQLVIMKILHQTDSRSPHGQLSIPIHQVRSRNFLKPEEITRLGDGGENRCYFCAPIA